MTQDWLTRELAYESVFDEQVSSAATPTTWPHVREADGTQAQSDRINQLRSWDFDVWQYDEEVAQLRRRVSGDGRWALIRYSPLFLSLSLPRPFLPQM